jgi:hypothetical protein
LREAVCMQMYLFDECEKKEHHFLWRSDGLSGEVWRK